MKNPIKKLIEKLKRKPKGENPLRNCEGWHPASQPAEKKLNGWLVRGMVSRGGDALGYTGCRLCESELLSGERLASNNSEYRVEPTRILLRRHRMGAPTRGRFSVDWWEPSKGGSNRPAEKKED